MATEYSEILGRHISEKTSSEIARIIDEIQCTVVFQELPEDNSHGFGYCNWFAKPDKIVASVTSLPQLAFEANLLHESYHLCQHHENFPMTSTKRQKNISAHDQDFLDRIGTVSSSLVLDLDVCDRIDNFGLNSAYFFDIRYRQAMSFHFEQLTRRDDQVSMVLRIAGVILQNSRRQSMEVCQHYQAKNRYIVQKAKGLARIIQRIDHNSPEGCFKCLTAMYDYLNIWDWQEIFFRGQVFRDSQAANTFLDSCCPRDSE